MKYQKCSPLALGYAGAILSAAIMLVMGILGNLGIYMKTITAMMGWHMFFSLSVVGIIGGMIEAAVLSFVFLYLLSWLYNKFV